MSAAPRLPSSQEAFKDLPLANQFEEIRRQIVDKDNLAQARYLLEKVDLTEIGSLKAAREMVAEGERAEILDVLEHAKTSYEYLHQNELDQNYNNLPNSPENIQALEAIRGRLAKTLRMIEPGTLPMGQNKSLEPTTSNEVNWSLENAPDNWEESFKNSHLPTNEAPTDLAQLDNQLLAEAIAEHTDLYAELSQFYIKARNQQDLISQLDSNDWLNQLLIEYATAPDLMTAVRSLVKGEQALTKEDIADIIDERFQKIHTSLKNLEENPPQNNNPEKTIGDLLDAHENEMNREAKISNKQSKITKQSPASNAFQNPAESSSSLPSNGKMINALLQNPKMNRVDSPACRLIFRTLEERYSDDEERLKLINFLKNPEVGVVDYHTIGTAFSSEEDKDGLQAISKVLGNKSINDISKLSSDDYQKLLKNLKIEESAVQRKISGFSNLQSMTPENQEKLDEYNEKMKAIEFAKDALDLAIKASGKRFKYSSPGQLLGMIHLYENADNPNATAIAEQTQQLISEEMQEMYKNSPGWKSKLSFFSGSMNTVLGKIAEDNRFKSLGSLEERQKILKELNTVKMKNEDEVEKWVDNLEGDKDKNMQTVIPTLLAYLDYALMTGQANKWGSVENVRVITENLKNVRNEYLDLQNNEEAQEKGWTEDKKSMELLKKIYAADANVFKIFNKGTFWSPNTIDKVNNNKWLKTAGVGLGATAAATLTWPILAGAGVVGAGTLAFKNPEKAKKVWNATKTSSKHFYKGGKFITKNVINPTVGASVRTAGAGLKGFGWVAGATLWPPGLLSPRKWQKLGQIVDPKYILTGKRGYAPSFKSEPAAPTPPPTSKPDQLSA